VTGGRKGGATNKRGPGITTQNTKRGKVNPPVGGLEKSHEWAAKNGEHWEKKTKRVTEKLPDGGGLKKPLPI